MPIKAFNRIPSNLREWSNWLNATSVTPDVDSVTHEMLEPSAALSVLGQPTATAGSVSDIAASGNGQYLGRRSDVVGFFALQDTDIPSTIARDTEVATAVSDHVAAADPHTQYAQEGSGTFTGTLTGCTTSPTGTLRYTVSGAIVTLYIPAISATSNTTAATVTGAPAAIFPARAQRVMAPIQDNTAKAAGLIQVETDGTLTLYPTVAAGSFTAGGTKGVELITVTYSLE